MKEILKEFIADILDNAEKGDTPGDILLKAEVPMTRFAQLLKAAGIREDLLEDLMMDFDYSYD